MQEEGGGNGARVASGIFEVSKVILQGVGVFFFERHAPELFAAGFAAVDDVQGEGVVIAEETSNSVTESAYHGTCKRSEIDNVCGSDKACFGKAVAEDEASFGIGVIDHDRLSVLGGKDVARQYGLVADGVFGEAAHGAYLDR